MRLLGTIRELLRPTATAHVALVVAVVCAAISTIPINIEFLAPLEIALKEFEYSDVVASRLQPPEPRRVDTSLVIVNIGYARRFDIARAISIARDAGAKAIGVDAVFSLQSDSAEQEYLVSTINSTPNIVMGEVLKNPNEHDDGIVYTYHERGLQGSNVRSLYGNVNLQGSSSFKTVRYWDPVSKVGPSYSKSLALQLYEVFTGDTTRYSSYPDPIYVRYQRQRTWYSIDIEQLLDGDINAIDVKNKIVLFGYLGSHIGDTNSTEDRFYTTQNQHYIGRSAPDMYGVEIHATILSMLLHHDFVMVVPSWVDMGVGLVLSYIILSFNRKISRRNPSLGETLTRVAQAVLLTSVFSVMAYCYLEWSLLLPVDLSIACCVLCLDIATLYDGTAATVYRRIQRGIRITRVRMSRRTIRRKRKSEEVPA